MAVTKFWILVGLMWMTADGAEARSNRKATIEVTQPRHFLEMTSLRIQTNVLYRYATTQMTVVMDTNNADFSKMAAVPVWIPDNAYITGASMEVNGTLHKGKLEKRENGQKRPLKVKLEAADFLQWPSAQYLQLTWSVPPYTSVTFNVTYEELLVPRDDFYSHMVYLGPGLRAQDVHVSVTIRESQRMASFKAQFTSTTGSTTTDPTLIKIKRMGSKKVGVTFRPTDRAHNSTLPTLPGRFLARYQLKRKGLLGSLLVEQGHFVHYFAPSGLPAVPRKVVLILDVSVSMVGSKLNALRRAVDGVLDALGPGDKFNIIAFSITLQLYRHNGLVPANEDTILQGKRFFETTAAGGGTNINDALLRGLHLLAHDRNDGHVCAPMILFVTDGPPTSGITSPEVILTNVRRGNLARTTIYSVGLGTAADRSFLRKLALQNSGDYINVPENHKMSENLAHFFAAFRTPVMTNVRFQYSKFAVDYDSLSKYDFNLLYNGTELTVAGKILPSNNKKLSTNVYGSTSGGSVNIEKAFNSGGFVNRETGSVPRTWAWLKYRAEQAYMVKSANSTIRERIKLKATAIALENNMLTPVTTLLIKAPDSGKNILWYKDQDKHFERVIRKTEKTTPLTNKRHRHRKADGKTSFVDNDPHFVVRMPGLDNPVCFDIGGHHGNIYQLIHDPTTGITVNGRLANVPDDQNKKKTYFDRISIITPDTTLTATIPLLHIKGYPVLWAKTTNYDTDSSLISVTSEKNVTISFGNDIMLAVLKHRIRRHDDFHYLGFYVLDGGGFSSVTHGLIGQFLNKQGKITIPDDTPDPTVANLLVRGPRVAPYTVKAKLRRRRNMAVKQHVSCWHVGGNAHGLIEGEHMDYLVPRMSHRGQNRVERRTTEAQKKLVFVPRRGLSNVIEI